MAFLEVKNITKHFEDVNVLKGIDLSLEKGEVLSIIGSSGSGKTTLLRCLNFLETPDKGTMSIDGKIIFDAANKKKMSDAERQETIRRLEKEMQAASKMLEFEYAALLRDQIIELRKQG